MKILDASLHVNKLVREGLKAVFSQFRSGIREILLDRRVLVTSNMEGIQNLAVGALEAFLPIYAVIICGFSPFQAGFRQIPVGAANIEAVPRSVDAVRDRFPQRNPAFFRP